MPIKKKSPTKKKAAAPTLTRAQRAVWERGARSLAETLDGVPTADELAFPELLQLNCAVPRLAEATLRTLMGMVASYEIGERPGAMDMWWWHREAMLDIALRDARHLQHVGSAGDSRPPMR
jgi:hypothetical protein